MVYTFFYAVYRSSSWEEKETSEMKCGAEISSHNTVAVRRHACWGRPIINISLKREEKKASVAHGAELTLV